MNKKSVRNIITLTIAFVAILIIVNATIDRLYVDGKDAKYWHNLYIQESLSLKKLNDCVNTGTILSPEETKIKPLTDLVSRVRLNCVR